MKRSILFTTLFLHILFAHNTSFAVLQNFNNQRVLPVDIDAQKYPELAKFTEKYRCSSEMEAMGKAADQKQFYLKGAEISRIINRERMAVVMNNHGLESLVIPEKCLFNDGDRLVVASKAIETKTIAPRVLTKSELQQLVALIEQTRFGDVVVGLNHNIALSEDDKIVLFDLEDVSFRNPVLISVVMLIQNARLEKDALEWAKNYVAFHPSWIDVFGFFANKSLSQNAQYDAQIGVDFTQVKKEFALLNKARNQQ